MKHQTYDNIAAGIAAGASRRDAVVITPILRLPADGLADFGAGPDDTVWASQILLSHRKGFRMERIAFGLVRTIDTYDNPHAATREQAAAVHAGVVWALRKLFDEVHLPADPIEGAAICARLWPGNQSEEMLAHMVASGGVEGNA
jgi:hypothetical protein